MADDRGKKTRILVRAKETSKDKPRVARAWLKPRRIFEPREVRLLRWLYSEQGYSIEELCTFTAATRREVESLVRGTDFYRPLVDALCSPDDRNPEAMQTVAPWEADKMRLEAQAMWLERRRSNPDEDSSVAWDYVLKTLAKRWLFSPRATRNIVFNVGRVKDSGGLVPAVKRDGGFKIRRGVRYVESLRGLPPELVGERGRDFQLSEDEKGGEDEDENGNE